MTFPVRLMQTSSCGYFGKNNDSLYTEVYDYEYEGRQYSDHHMVCTLQNCSKTPSLSLIRDGWPSR